jgi:hypothetical protein
MDVLTSGLYVLINEMKSGSAQEEESAAMYRCTICSKTFPLEQVLCVGEKECVWSQPKYILSVVYYPTPLYMCI